MPDREKVIKGLEYCAASCKGAWDENNGCPYLSDFINGRCVDLLCADALALLKEQEPVELIENAGFYFCGACRYAFTSARQKFCPNCGRAVKRDE